jgi:hypothetical protein
MTTAICRLGLCAIALLWAALSGCVDEDCNQTGCPVGRICAAVCDDWSSGCAHYECVQCASDDDCNFGEICRDNACRPSYLGIQCSELCQSTECAVPSGCLANGMVCTDMVYDPWGHCMTPCSTNADCPGPDDRKHWIRCVDCPDQPSFCIYNSYRCPGEEGTVGPSGSSDCDYSGCLQVCTEAGGSNCGTDCSCD